MELPTTKIYIYAKIQHGQKGSDNCHLLTFVSSDKARSNVNVTVGQNILKNIMGRETLSRLYMTV